MKRTRTTLLMAGLGTAALMLSGCSALGGSATANDSSAGGGIGGDITVAQVTEPNIPDPLMDGSLAGYNLFYAVFDQVTEIDGDGFVQPKLATEWTSNEDFTSWDFTLRDDAVFTNGEPVTAADVVFSYQTVITTPESTNRGYLTMLDHAEVVDDSTVRFVLKESFTAWPNQASMISIVPEAVYTELGSEGFAKAPVGSGPFVFSSWTRGVEYVVERNEDYWGGAPALDSVTFAVVPTEDSRVTGAESGALDVALVPPNQVPTIEASQTVELRTRAANEVTFMGTNSTSGPLADARIRQAVDLAIDRSAIIDGLLGGLGTLNGQLVGPGVTGYDADFPTPEYDPEAAEALLAEAGYAGETIPFEYATDGRIPLGGEVAQAIGGYLEAVGISVEMIGADQASHTLKLRGHEFQGLYLNTWAPSSMDGDIVIGDMFAPEANNDYAYDPDAAALVLEQQGADEATRAELFTELFTLNADEAWILPLYTPNYSYAVDPALDWEPRADGLFRFDEASLS